MVGCRKTSTYDAMTSAPPSLSSKSKILKNALVATPTFSGNLLTLASMQVIVKLCFSTCLAKGISQIKEQDRRYTNVALMALVLVEVAGVAASQVRVLNHLMGMEIVLHGQIVLHIVYQSMLREKTCSQTKRKQNSL